MKGFHGGLVKKQDIEVVSLKLVEAYLDGKAQTSRREFPMADGTDPMLLAMSEQGRRNKLSSSARHRNGECVQAAGCLGKNAVLGNHDGLVAPSTQEFAERGFGMAKAISRRRLEQRDSCFPGAMHC